MTRRTQSKRSWRASALLAAVVGLLVLLVVGINTRTLRGDSGARPLFDDGPLADTGGFPMKVTYIGWSGDTAKALNLLRSQISDILSGPAYRGVTVSTKIVLLNQANAPHDVFGRNDRESVLPASVEKLFTSSSTLWALGTKYSFLTKIDLAPGATVSAGIVKGSLLFRPSGDPTLQSGDLDDLAQKLTEQGITTIDGDIVSDIGNEEGLSPQAKKFMSEQDAPLVVPDTGVQIGENGVAPVDSLEQNLADDEEEDAGDPGALSSYPNFSLDRNVMRVTVSAGGAKGSATSVRISPQFAGVVIRNYSKSSAPATMHTKKVGKKKKKRTVRFYTRGVMTLHVSSSGGADDSKQIITITGQIPARGARTYAFPIKNIPLAAATILRTKLIQAGIAVHGVARVDNLKTDGPIRTLASKETKLLDLLKTMNKRSDNYLAESMFRKLSTIATVAATAPDERARKLMRSWLRVCNVDGTQCTMMDGSGLSRGNRTTASSVIDLLTAIRQQGLFETFTQTMSVAGFDGTLRNRLKGTPAQYNAHGKTGTLNGVTAVAGYVTTADGQLAEFFITMQKLRKGAAIYKRDQNRIIETLSRFRYQDYVAEAAK